MCWEPNHQANAIYLELERMGESFEQLLHTHLCHSLTDGLPLCLRSFLTGFQAWVRSKRLPVQDEYSLKCTLCFLAPAPPSPRLLLAPLLSARPSVRSQYDNRADDLTKDGMLKGIESSAAFVLFLSTGVLERPYCQMEIRHALALKKPVVLLHGESESTKFARPHRCLNV